MCVLQKLIQDVFITKKQTFFPLSVSMICHIVTHKSFLWDKFDFFPPI